MNRRLRVAIQISTSTGDHRSSSTEAFCKLITAFSRPATERTVETDSAYRMAGPIHARPSMRASVPIGGFQMMEGWKSTGIRWSCTIFDK
jgi:hypothetical protein